MQAICYKTACYHSAGRADRRAVSGSLLPCAAPYESLAAISDADKCVYLNSIRGSRWPLINATSGRLRPRSKKRLIASWRRSCIRRSSRPARPTALAHPSFMASAVVGNTIPVWQLFNSLRMVSAGPDSGTSRDCPFLVSRSCANRIRRSTFSHRRPSASPRLIPVSIRKSENGISH